MRIDTLTPQFKPGPADADKQNDGRLLQACRDFEGLLLEQMLASMRRSVPKSGLFGDSPASEIYESMRDEQLARDLAARGGLGFADALYHQLSRPDKSGR